MMMRHGWVVLLGIVLATFAAGGWLTEHSGTVLAEPAVHESAVNESAASESRGQEALLQQAQATFGVVDAATDAERRAPLAELGQKLFWDTRLSINGKVACASCHLPRNWGADRARFSVDAKDRKTSRNSQTVFNAALQPKLRWTADRKSAAHQAERSLTGSMGLAEADDIVPLLVRFGYESDFNKAFPDDESPLSPANYSQAIDAYEQTLRTPARFDEYLRGRINALSPEQRAGLKLFLDIGCADCHTGRLLGGESLEKFGVTKDYWLATKSEQRDAGLFQNTGDEADRYRFRVSMLRNIAKTGPYFHDGSVDELPQAVRIMADVQLGKQLTDVEVARLVAFLGSLTGETPSNYRNPRTEANTGK